MDFSFRDSVFSQTERPWAQLRENTKTHLCAKIFNTLKKMIYFHFFQNRESLEKKVFFHVFAQTHLLRKKIQHFEEKRKDMIFLFPNNVKYFCAKGVFAHFMQLSPKGRSVWVVFRPFSGGISCVYQEGYELASPVFPWQ